MSDLPFEPPSSTAATFGFGEVPSAPAAEDAAAAAQPDPPLEALKSFTGTFTGKGFNTIFRPDSAATPTDHLPLDQNVLELNLTDETLWFMPPLGSVPNRGRLQEDAFLNCVPYLQTIKDITNPAMGSPVIHVEPGLWVTVPRVKDQKAPHVLLPGALVRMASIPHGTTITAQGGSSQLTAPFNMQKVIKPIDIAPFGVSDPNDVIPVGQARAERAIGLDSLDPGNQKTARLPQDLTTVPAITQAMLSDPATFIRNHSAHQNITSIVEITVNTKHGRPLLGGGISNTALLLGYSQTDTPAAKVGTLDDASDREPNAQAVNVQAAFWIETVEYTVHVPAMQPGQVPLKIAAEASFPGAPVPRFVIDPPVPVPAPRTIKVAATQIQYAQQVFLNFADVVWPHVSVATLVPLDALPVPASAWS